MKSSEFYKTTAWKHFSRYCLLYYSKDGDLVKCSTSGRYYALNDKRMHCGHLVKVFNGNSSNFSVAFDFRNVLPQCHKENVHKGGNELVMMQAVDKIHGEGTTKELIEKSKQWFKLDKSTLDQIAKEYKQKFDDLVKKKGNPWK